MLYVLLDLFASTCWCMLRFKCLRTISTQVSQTAKNACWGSLQIWLPIPQPTCSRSRYFRSSCLDYYASVNCSDYFRCSRSVPWYMRTALLLPPRTFNCLYAGVIVSTAIILFSLTLYHIAVSSFCFCFVIMLIESSQNADVASRDADSCRAFSMQIHGDRPRVGQVSCY